MRQKIHLHSFYLFLFSRLHFTFEITHLSIHDEMYFFLPVKTQNKASKYFSVHSDIWAILLSCSSMHLKLVFDLWALFIIIIFFVFLLTVKKLELNSQSPLASLSGYQSWCWFINSWPCFSPCPNLWVLSSIYLLYLKSFTELAVVLRTK